MPRSGRARRAAIVAACALGAATAARAQRPTHATLAPNWIEAVSAPDLEDHLRTLQLTGALPLHPWGVRAFSPAELLRIAPRGADHPWASAFELPLASGGTRLSIIRPDLRLGYASARSDATDDGPVWTGRGVTGALHGGLVAMAGPVTVVLDPVLFLAQNAGAPSDTGATAFMDRRHAGRLDAPRWFGAGSYSRLHPGQSQIRADLGYLALGLSTANEVWGPAATYPLVLGRNAPGFARAFLGSARPVPIWIGQVHGRIMLGRLGQSDHAGVPEDSARRLAAGIVATFTPRGLPGLELGGTRFFHRLWPDGGPGLADLAIPFEGLLKSRLADKDASADNQLASVFMRYALPAAGVEVYGELAREDHNADLRDLAVEPDHQSAYVLGARKAWSRPGRIVTLRAEVLDARVTHLAMVREQSPFYEHYVLRQGHTNDGQLLGSPAALAGSATHLATDWYHARGSWGASWERVTETPTTNEQIASTRTPARHAVALRALRFQRQWDLMAELAGLWNLRRDGGVDSDFSLRFGVRVHADRRPGGVRIPPASR